MTKFKFEMGADAKSSVNDKGLVELSFVGYTGAPVDVSDYGLEHPIIYNLSGMESKQTIPILYEHYSPLGHTTEITNDGSQVGGRGLASFPGERNETIVTAMKNGFPFQSSIGIVAMSNNITLLKSGEKRTVNNREITGPMFVVENSVLEEMTVTTWGRDGNTSFMANNKEAVSLLNSMSTKFKNSDTKPADATPPAADPAPATPPAPAPVNVDNNKPAPTPAPAPTVPAVINNAAPAPGISGGYMVGIQRLINSYPDEACLDIIEKGADAGADLLTIENKIKLHLFENNLPKVPAIKNNDGRNSEESRILAHFAMAVGINPERLEKSGVDKKLIDLANSRPQWSFHETLTHIANSMGGQYTGFSDMENMCEFINKHNRMSFLNVGNYSNIDMPNLFKKVTDMMLEDRWTLNQPFATQHLKEESNKDFRTVQRFRPGGGEIWEGVKNDGKLQQTTFGKETEYRSNLATYGQMVVFPREVVVNDDMGVIAELLDAMVEGAMIIPDIQLGKLMLTQAAAAGTFWVNDSNSFTSKGLTRPNLSTAYTAIRQYMENRGKNIVTMVNDRWKLITGISKEETAWELLNQNYIVSNTNSNTIQGSKNFWFGKFDQATFAQMSNSNLLGTGTFVSENTWVLWPSSKKYSPYSITYLRGRKRPTVETVELPGDMLGFGVRGFWDVKINERERQFIHRYNG